MAEPSEEYVYIRGPGFNRLTLPNRARELFGAEWQTAIEKVKVLAVRRGGVLHVQAEAG